MIKVAQSKAWFMLYNTKLIKPYKVKQINHRTRDVNNCNACWNTYRKRHAIKGYNAEVMR